MSQEYKMTREDFLTRELSIDMFGLEVGPGYAPTFPRHKGWNVETLDHATAHELRDKYRGLTDISKIEHIDYVSDGRPIHQSINKHKVYDFIYASHVIEHITDPVRFFQSCEYLLKDTGKLVLVVPDKRYCFDALQSITSTGEFLSAYNEEATRHSPGRAFDFIANTVGLGSHGIWESHWTGEFNITNSFDQAKYIFERASRSEKYIDIHAWAFTPNSFRLIIHDLNKLGLIRLCNSVVIPSQGMEFYFSSSIGSEDESVDRLDIYKHIIRDQIEGFNQLLGNEP